MKDKKIQPIPEKSKLRTLTEKEWRKEAISLFGKDAKKWKFVCPSCGVVTSVQDWKDAGDENGGMIAFSCIGRLKGSKNTLGSKKQPCNYAGGGLFGLNPITVIFKDGGETELFDFYRGKTK